MLLPSTGHSARVLTHVLQRRAWSVLMRFAQAITCFFLLMHRGCSALFAERSILFDFTLEIHLHVYVRIRWHQVPVPSGLLCFKSLSERCYMPEQRRRFHLLVLHRVLRDQLSVPGRLLLVFAVPGSFTKLVGILCFRFLFVDSRFGFDLRYVRTVAPARTAPLVSRARAHRATSGRVVKHCSTRARPVPA